MNWVGTVWPMISAASLTLAIVYGLAWLRETARISHLLIAVAAASVAAVGLLELAAMTAQDPARYARMIRWAHVPVAISAICVVGFVFHQYRVGSPALAVAAIATRAACLLPNFLTGVNINYASIDSLHPVMFLGAQVNIPDQATPNPWMLLGTGNALLVAAFLVQAIVQLRARRPSRERTRAIATCATILAFAVASGLWTTLVVRDFVQAPLLYAPLFLGVLLAMTHTLATGFGSAGRLAHSLEFARRRHRAARRRMQQAEDAAGVGFWTLDTGSGRVRLSHHACALVGASRREVMTRADLLARLPPQDHGAFLAAADAFAHGEFHCEFRVILAEGRHRWLAAYGRPIPGEQGQRSLDGVLVDITHRKESESRFRMVVEAASAPHVVVAPTGKVAFANRAAASLFGYAQDALAGIDLRDLIRPDAASADDTRPHGWLASATLGKGVEVTGIRKGSSTPIALAAMFNPVPFESDLYLLVSLADLADRRRAEREASLQRDDAHLSRVSMLETLSGSLAHELNQPLAAILANAQAARRFLDRQVPDLDEVRASLAAIAESDMRAAEIIKRLRALLRKDTSQFGPFDMASAIDEVAGLLRGDLLIREVELCLEVAQPLPIAWGDSIQIQQVILNLVMNACDSMREHAPPRQVLLRATEKNGDLLVTVVDRGTGIVEQDLERIFQPFHTSKRDGLGLGLAVCRTIVAAHRGQIWAQSAGAGEGAAVSFRLPSAGRQQVAGTGGGVAAADAGLPDAIGPERSSLP